MRRFLITLLAAILVGGALGAVAATKAAGAATASTRATCVVLKDSQGRTVVRCWLPTIERARWTRIR